MKFIKIKTRKFLPPKDNIYGLLNHLPKLKEGDVVFITSKVLAIAQGRCVKITDKIKKSDLIYKEAEKYVNHPLGPDLYFILTIKENTLIPSSGIDESNGNGYYILWPKNVNKLLKEIWQYLRKKHKIKKLAVIATDSHTIPLRWGVLGISIGFYGLEGVSDLRGTKDIFGRKLKYTRVNIVDALSGIAVLLMGEGGNRTPMIIIRGANFVKFTNKNAYKKLVIPKGKDIYAPLLKIFRKFDK